MTTIKSQQARAARAIKARWPEFEPEVGIILGSGLGGLANHIEKPVYIGNYDSINNKLIKKKNIKK